MSDRDGANANAVESTKSGRRFARTWRIDLAAGVLVALLAGLAFREVAGGQGATFEEKGEPFKTHANMLLVRATINRDTPPAIERVEKLAQGRVTQLLPGPNKVEVLDEAGNVLYSQSFGVRFLLTTDPPRDLESVTALFVLPYDEKVKSVRVTTEKGAAEAPVE
jgi:hypothetical protein